MRSEIAALVLGLTLFGTVLIADRGSPDLLSAETPLSTNPFAKARVGDWSCYVERITEGRAKARTQVALWRVISADDLTVTTRGDVRDASDKHWVPGLLRTFSRRVPPTIGELFAIPGVRPKITDVKLTTEAARFGARSFSCQRVAFTGRGEGARDGSAEVVARVCDAIPASAFFGIHIQAYDDNGETTIDYELAGFGHGDETELGQSPDEIDLASVAQRR